MATAAVHLDAKDAVPEIKEARAADVAGSVQQLRAPGKMFARMEILAILRSRKAVLDERPSFHAAVRELETLADIFERIE